MMQKMDFLDYFLRTITYACYFALTFFALFAFFTNVLTLYAAWVIWVSVIGAMMVALGVVVIYDERLGKAIISLKEDLMQGGWVVPILAGTSSMAKGFVFALAVANTLLIFCPNPSSVFMVFFGIIALLFGLCAFLMQLGKLYPQARDLLDQREHTERDYPWLLLAPASLVLVGHSLGQFALVVMAMWSIFSLVFPNSTLFFVIKAVVCGLSGLCIAITAGRQYGKPAMDYIFGSSGSNNRRRLYCLSKPFSVFFAITKGLLVFISVLHIAKDLGVVSSLMIAHLPIWLTIVAFYIALSTMIVQYPHADCKFGEHLVEYSVLEGLEGSLVGSPLCYAAYRQSDNSLSEPLEPSDCNNSLEYV